MEKKFVEELNLIRKEFEIPEDAFYEIMCLAIMRRDKSKIKISDEMLFEIIQDAIVSYDLDVENSEKEQYFDAIRFLINDEKNERHVSDDVLFETIEEYLNLIQERPRKKTPIESVERAFKSLGI